MLTRAQARENKIFLTTVQQVSVLLLFFFFFKMKRVSCLLCCNTHTHTHMSRCERSEGDTTRHKGRQATIITRPSKKFQIIIQKYKTHKPITCVLLFSGWAYSTLKSYYLKKKKCPQLLLLHSAESECSSGGPRSQWNTFAQCRTAAPIIIMGRQKPGLFLRKGKLPADTSNGAEGRVSGYCAKLGRKKKQKKNTSVMLHRCAKKRPDDRAVGLFHIPAAMNIGQRRVVKRATKEEALQAQLFPSFINST